MSTRTNYCDIDRFYNDASVPYGFPENLLRSYLVGNGLGNSTLYSAEEQAALQEDISVLSRRALLSGSRARHAVIGTKGAGVAKTGLLYSASRSHEGRSFAYVHSEDHLILDMPSYLRDRALEMESPISPVWDDEGLQVQSDDAAKKWQPGARAAKHIMLANLIQEGVAFCCENSSMGHYTSDFLKSLKDEGYTVKVIHVSMPGDEEGEILASLVNDAYLKYADEIAFHYLGADNEKSVHAATWKRLDVTALSGKEGTLTIHHKEAFGKVRELHDQNSQDRGQKWANAVDKISSTHFGK